MADNSASRLPYIEPSIRTIAGLLVTVLGVLIFTAPQETPVWLGLLFFISLNLFQSGITHFCMMEKLLKLVGFRSELGEIRALNEQAQRSAALQSSYVATLSLLNEAVIEMSCEGVLHSVSDGWNRLLAGSGRYGSAAGTSLTDYVYEEDRPLLERCLTQILSSAQELHSVRFRMVNQGNREQWVGGKFMVRTTPQGERTVKGVLSDITDSYRRERQIAHMAMHDALTGLPNRSLLEEHMSKAIARAERDGERVGLLFIDLDNFKQINDFNGHKTGDKLLMAVATVMQGRVRKNDTLSRWGGDEFVLLLPCLQSPADLRGVAQTLVHKINDELAGYGLETPVTFSVGGATYPDDADSTDSLLAQADKALYYAKSQGRNNIQIYAEMRQLDIGFNDFDMTHRFSCAIRERRIRPHYQMVIDARSQQPCGVEALARWHDDKYGAVSPYIFIPLAENMGLIEDVSQQMLEHALRDMGVYLAQHPTFRLSVNFSARELTSTALPARLHALVVGEYGLSPSQLQVEITESQCLSLAQGQATLKKLREMGFGLSLDDFGTGFSSLSNLDVLPVQELKIDQSFVRRLSDQKGRMLLESIIQLGHSLKLQLVAEGVEDPVTALALQSMGVDRLQGYHFSKPMPWVEICDALEPKSAAVQLNVS